MALFHVGFISYTLLREVDINVVFPTMTIPGSMGMNGEKPTHAHKAPYPVLYLLHGMGNNYSVWGRYTSIERYAEERQICVVMISGENKGYRNQTGGGGMFGGQGDRHFDFLAHELPEFIQANFDVSKDPKDTYIAGLSMGSMGTILHALSEPERFRAAGAFSGPAMKMPRMEPGADMAAMQREMASKKAEDMIDDVSDEAKELIAAGKAAGKTFPDFFISTGAKDGPERSKAFALYLESQGIKVTTDIGTKDYGHEWQFWDETVKEFLDWLPRTDAYAGEKRKI